MLTCDIRDLDQVDKVFASITELDLLVTSAFPFLEDNPFNWAAFENAQRLFAGHVRAMHNASTLMTNGGRMVNILGQCVRNGLPSAPHYSMFFAALHNYGKSINGNPRYGKARKNPIQVLDVLIAASDTREWDGVSAAVKASYEKGMSQFIPPEEVALRVLFELGLEVMATELVVDGYVLV